MFLGGDIRFSQTPTVLFKNCTWTAPNTSALYCKGIENWKGPGGEYSIFLSLTCFVVTFFFLTALASTLPIPAGIFGPSFVLGGAMGRIIGEFVAVLYPDGIRGPDELQIYPGVYAVV
uniref:Uncharacterized protein n=1 Tax=Acrobeloides nanus TaxID=290746 RepID=A0A914D056_9BILA